MIAQPLYQESRVLFEAEGSWGVRSLSQKYIGSLRTWGPTLEEGVLRNVSPQTTYVPFFRGFLARQCCSLLLCPRTLRNLPYSSCVPRTVVNGMTTYGRITPSMQTKYAFHSKHQRRLLLSSSPALKRNEIPPQVVPFMDSGSIWCPRIHHLSLPKFNLYLVGGRPKENGGHLQRTPVCEVDFIYYFRWMSVSGG